jgi:N-acetylglutamate synthase-like GNAT family acetyltransferase
MEIREASIREIKAIARLMLDEFSKHPFKERATIDSVIKSLNFYFKIGKAFVAVIDNKIIGVIIFKTEQWWNGRVLLIEDLAVKDEFKNQGIGKQLLAKIENYAKRNKIKTITFSTNRKSSSIKFYKKQGYKVMANRISMEKKLR